jgi:hypothetical protein
VNMVCDVDEVCIATITTATLHLRNKCAANRRLSSALE